ncbi:hypothetical protein CJ030_MR1G018596 [Morella rubra]|uniref:Gamma-butyrobetaine hydroxylase-like N-terminal domain-containing protein n=1 Tax=Morella rubra TaxID=262757 RepID=A0A6A1WJW9_9ROSI|nr:hypothetical protein CJ030_MR1G018596 [Morella rubra]
MLAIMPIHVAKTVVRSSRLALVHNHFSGCFYLPWMVTSSDNNVVIELKLEIGTLHVIKCSGEFDFLNLSFQVEVEFADGSVFNLSAEFLRVQSPAVDAKVRSIGGEKVISGRRHVGIMSAEPVGNYGVRIVFDDLHKTGIYPWNYFYQLGSNKFTLLRNYIKTLKKHGLSRDPPRRK